MDNSRMVSSTEKETTIEELSANVKEGIYKLRDMLQEFLEPIPQKEERVNTPPLPPLTQIADNLRVALHALKTAGETFDMIKMRIM